MSGGIPRLKDTVSGPGDKLRHLWRGEWRRSTRTEGQNPREDFRETGTVRIARFAAVRAAVPVRGPTGRTGRRSLAEACGNRTHHPGD